MFSYSDLKSLLENEGGPCVSIYLQTARSGPDVRRNPIELKNALKEARAHLSARGIEKQSCDSILAPLETWQDDDELHQHLDEGMAIFLAPDFSRYLLSPEPFDFRVDVGGAFCIRPLLPLLARDASFLVLALDRESVRLFTATRHGIQERSDDLPESWDKIRGMTDYEKQTGFHPSGPTPTTTGAPTPSYHSYGESPDELRKVQTEEFVGAVAKAVEDVMAQQPDRQLILCAGPELAGIFRQRYDGPGLLAELIDANPAGLDDDGLHERGYALIEPALREAREEEAGRFLALQGAGEARAATEIGEIVPASAQGRIETLFVARDAVQRGNFDPASQTATVHENSEQSDIDLLDLAARETLRHGGSVFVPLLENMPTDAPVAAIFRY